MELFETIKQYPRYQVSNYGRIWDTERNRFVAQIDNGKGYKQCNLWCGDGRRKKEYIHRLVAITFIENPKHLPEVDHKDRNRNNNNVDNLMWVSRSQNQRNTNNNHKISVYDISNDKTYIFNSMVECVEELNIPLQTLYSVLKNKNICHKKYIIQED